MDICGWKRLLLVIILITGSITVHLTFNYTSSAATKLFLLVNNSETYDLEFFTDSNNVSGYPRPIVPNIIHFLRMHQPYFDFNEMISLKSAYLNHQPDRILIHCDNCSFYGKYWDMIKNISTLELVHFKPPTGIFGHKFSQLWHASDLVRAEILMKHGGIYLDNDVFVVQSLNKFLHFEMVLDFENRNVLGSQVQIAHPNARYLKLFKETFRNYHGNRWYFNGGELPTWAIIYKHPELIHRVEKQRFGVEYFGILRRLYTKYWSGWEENYTVHFLTRHTDQVGLTLKFDEQNIKTYKNTYGAMARSIYYGTKDLILD